MLRNKIVFRRKKQNPLTHVLLYMPISSDLDLGTPYTESKPRILGISRSSSTNISNLDEFRRGLVSWANDDVVNTPNKAKEKKPSSKTLSMVFIIVCMQALSIYRMRERCGYLLEGRGTIQVGFVFDWRY